MWGRGPIRCWTGWWATRSPTSATSCARPKTYRAATDAERAALQDLSETLAAHEGSVDPEGLQAVVYEVGRRHFPDLSGKAKSPDGRPGVSQAWFTTIYNVLFGEARGPRFGSFIALYGVAETRALIAQALDGAFLPPA